MSGEFIIALTGLIQRHACCVQGKVVKISRTVTLVIFSCVSSACRNNQQSTVAFVVWMLEVVLLNQVT